MRTPAKHIRFKNYAYALLVMAVSLAANAQQQTVLTNIMLNQYVYNTAYAGVDSGTTFNALYRNQWVGFEGAPKSYMFSGYGNFKKKPNMTIGGSVSTERIGLFQQTGFYGSYCYKLKINKKYAISFGLAVGAIQYNVKAYNARPYDADDHFLQSPLLNALAFDANAGFYFYSRKFFLGFSNQHMPNSKIQWDNSQGKLTPHFYAYAGYNINFDKAWNWVLQPSVLIRTDSPSPYQLEYNLKLLYRSMFWIGVSYRDQSSLNGLIGIKVNNQFTFGYSYDYTTSKLSTYQSGSHEIMLSYLIPFKKKKSKSEKIQEADDTELNTIDNTLKTNLKSKKKEQKDKGGKTAEPGGDEKPATETDTNPDDKKPESTDQKTPEKKTKAPKKKAEKFKKEKNKHYKQADKASDNNEE